jgi:hypothetical protein
MLALALFIAAGAPNAWSLLVPARRVTRGSNRILSEASFEQHKLVAADAAAGDEFGRRVAIDGNTVVIGAPGAGTGGAVYVLRTTDGGATYEEIAKLTASGALSSDAASGENFGSSVAIDGDTIVVGAYGDDRFTGAAYVFRTTDGGVTYNQVAKLTASDAAESDHFGVSVAIDGNTVVVGAYYDDDAGTSSGSAYVFLTSDGGATYNQVAKLTASDAAEFDFFGKSVAIDGDTVVVAAWGKESYTGSAYVFRTSDGGATYDQVAKLTAADAADGDMFGRSVAIDGGTVVVAASSDDDACPDDIYCNSGSVYVFRTTDGATYVEVAKLTADGAAEGDYFGSSVAIDGATVVIGATGDDDGGSFSGSAYVFRTTDGGGTYDQVAKLTASDAAASDYFGQSVAIDGQKVVIGANKDDDAGSASGSAYLFSDAGSEGLDAGSDSAQTLGSDAATRTGPLLALLVAAVLAL